MISMIEVFREKTAAVFLAWDIQKSLGPQFHTNISNLRPDQLDRPP
jgi:hypothetical protein